MPGQAGASVALTCLPYDVAGSSGVPSLCSHARSRGATTTNRGARPVVEEAITVRRTWTANSRCRGKGEALPRPIEPSQVTALSRAQPAGRAGKPASTGINGLRPPPHTAPLDPTAQETDGYASSHKPDQLRHARYHARAGTGHNSSSDRWRRSMVWIILAIIVIGGRIWWYMNRMRGPRV